MILNSLHASLLSNLNIRTPNFLGKGMEGYVYDYSSDQVVKIWLIEYADKVHLAERRDFYRKIYGKVLKFDLPLIYEVGNYKGVFYTIEKKLLGESGESFYLNSDKETRAFFLDNYFKILDELNKIDMNDDYGELLSSSHGKTTTKNWKDFLKIKLEQTKEKCLKKPDHDLPNIEELFEKFYDDYLPEIDSHPTKKLVHGDLFLENILATEKGDISALLDFGPLTVVGDHLMDVAALVYFINVTQGIDDDIQDYLEKMAVKKYPGKLEIVKIYLLYFSLLFINSKKYDPRTYEWCLNNFKESRYASILHT